MKKTYEKYRNQDITQRCIVSLKLYIKDDAWGRVKIYGVPRVLHPLMFFRKNRILTKPSHFLALC